MTDEKITKEVASLIKQQVDDMWQRKEEADIRKETEEALRDSASQINKLTEELQSKDATITELNQEISTLKEEVVASHTSTEQLTSEKTVLEEEKAAWEAEKTELTKKLEEATTTLDNMQKEATASVRMEELTKAGVSATTEKAKNDQLSKLKDMSDEEFASYKNELVSVRESILAELKAKEESANDANSAGSTSQESASAGNDDDVAVASSRPPINPNYAVAAALNMEIVPTQDVTSKYAKFGKAMAARMKKSK